MDQIKPWICALSFEQLMEFAEGLAPICDAYAGCPEALYDRDECAKVTQQIGALRRRIDPEIS